jgi:hypothetical protein
VKKPTQKVRETEPAREPSTEQLASSKRRRLKTSKTARAALATIKLGDVLQALLASVLVIALVMTLIDALTACITLGAACS